MAPSLNLSATATQQLMSELFEPSPAERAASHQSLKANTSKSPVSPVAQAKTEALCSLEAMAALFNPEGDVSEAVPFHMPVLPEATAEIKALWGNLSESDSKSKVASAPRKSYDEAVLAYAEWEQALPGEFHAGTLAKPGQAGPQHFVSTYQAVSLVDWFESVRCMHLAEKAKEWLKDLSGYTVLAEPAEQLRGEWLHFGVLAKEVRGEDGSLRGFSYPAHSSDQLILALDWPRVLASKPVVAVALERQLSFFSKRAKRKLKNRFVTG